MKKHMKRLAAPKTWVIARKTSKFIARPLPGGHKTELSMPLNIIIRDVLHHGETAREAKSIIKNKTILVDGKRVNEERFSVGIMDTLKIQETGEIYRMLINTKGKLALKSISDEDGSQKVCRINRKSTIKGGKTSLGLHDGRTIIADSKEAYAPGDSILLKVPEQKMLAHFKLEKKSIVYLIGGRHKGLSGTVEDISGQKLAVKIGEDVLETLKKFAFVIGK